MMRGANILWTHQSHWCNSEIRWIHVGAAPAVSPHSRPAGVEGGWDANLLFDSPISDFLKAIPIIRTTHAPSLAPALGMGRTCSFSLCRPDAVGGCMGRANLFSCSLQILGSPISFILKSEIRHIPVGVWRTLRHFEAVFRVSITCSFSSRRACGSGGWRDANTFS